ncbi:hypothetical protein [Burkholderia glumae]|uniref:hypothetical protein n=1 Tax=Burkholderia glumae TaxID=337 RepID=UPI0021507D7B|nr:hypothetical protein [Burkholderia glumae]
MSILIVLIAVPLLLFVFVIGMTRVSFIAAPMLGFVAIFQRLIFTVTGADVEHPSTLGYLALQPWGLMTLVATILAALCAFAEIAGIRSRLLTGFLPPAAE